MTREKDHSAALAELRADEVNRLQSAMAWRRRAARAESRREVVAVARRCLAKIRALDAVRAYAADRAFFAELWMLMACGKSQDEAVREARKVLAERREIPGL